jgi:hypothetical protein
MSQADQLFQLKWLEKWIEEYLKFHPSNSGAFEPSGKLAAMDKRTRDGIVYYRGYWGWRVYGTWKTVLEERKKDLKQFVPVEWDSKERDDGH